jgi:hypothetical protein
MDGREADQQTSRFRPADDSGRRIRMGHTIVRAPVPRDAPPAAASPSLEGRTASPDGPDAHQSGLGVGLQTSVLLPGVAVMSWPTTHSSAALGWGRDQGVTLPR